MNFKSILINCVLQEKINKLNFFYNTKFFLDFTKFIMDKDRIHVLKISYLYWSKFFLNNVFGN